MKKKSLLLFLSFLGFCNICVSLKCTDQEEIIDLDDYLDEDEFEWEEGDNAFLDDVAGNVEHTVKDKHEISLLDKAMIGAKVVWSFCIVLPYQKAKKSYFDYVHPFVVYPFANNKEHKDKKGRTYVA